MRWRSQEADAPHIGGMEEFLSDAAPQFGPNWGVDFAPRVARQTLLLPRTLLPSFPQYSPERACPSKSGALKALVCQTWPRKCKTACAAAAAVCHVPQKTADFGNEDSA